MDKRRRIATRPSARSALRLRAYVLRNKSQKSQQCFGRMIGARGLKPRQREHRRAPCGTLALFASRTRGWRFVPERRCIMREATRCVRAHKDGLSKKQRCELLLRAMLARPRAPTNIRRQRWRLWEWATSLNQLFRLNLSAHPAILHCPCCAALEHAP